MKFHCRICGRALVEGSFVERCSYCGQEEKGDWHCPNGHYVCEACRTASAEAVIERTCLASSLKNPFDLAELILKHPAMPPYGAEYHLLPAPVLLAVLRNRGIPNITDTAIRQALARLSDVPPMVCGTRGDCGAAASAGAVIAIIRKATAFSDAERSAALRATASALLRIAAHGGPRCCRQSVFDTISTVWDLLRPDLDLEELPVRICPRTDGLKDCKTTRCPYYG